MIASMKTIRRSEGVEFQSKMEFQTLETPLESLADECLSYTWGSADVLYDVLVDETVVAVTQSLNGALTRLRNAEECRTLWVDQLCIDQGNLDERSEQVKIMHRIYQGAWRTVVYLHVDNVSDLDFALSHRRLIQEFIRSTAWPSLLAGQIGRSERVCERAISDFPTTKALLEMLSHSWFSRIWIIQEVSMSKSVLLYYRGETVDWTRLDVKSGLATQTVGRMSEADRTRHFDNVGLRHTTRTSERAGRKSRTERSRQLAGLSLSSHMPGSTEFRIASLNKLKYMTRLLSDQSMRFVEHRWPRGNKLISLLCTGRAFQSTDPRDRVFALLNLTNESYATPGSADTKTRRQVHAANITKPF